MGCMYVVEACRTCIQQGEWSRDESDRVPKHRRKQKGSNDNTKRVVVHLGEEFSLSRFWRLFLYESSCELGFTCSWNKFCKKFYMDSS